MMITDFITISSISRGSKNVFAYILTCFIMLLMIAYVKNVLDDGFRREVELPDAVLDIESKYLFELLSCLQLIAALQGWIFGDRYC
jgi:hypothetical protein